MSAIEEWDALVEKKMAGKTGDYKARQKAVIAVAIENPELHQAYLTAINAKRR